LVQEELDPFFPDQILFLVGVRLSGVGFHFSNLLFLRVSFGLDVCLIGQVDGVSLDFDLKDLRFRLTNLILLISDLFLLIKDLILLINNLTLDFFNYRSITHHLSQVFDLGLGFLATILGFLPLQSIDPLDLLVVPKMLPLGQTLDQIVLLLADLDRPGTLDLLPTVASGKEGKETLPLIIHGDDVVFPPIRLSPFLS